MINCLKPQLKERIEESDVHTLEDLLIHSSYIYHAVNTW